MWNILGQDNNKTFIKIGFLKVKKYYGFSVKQNREKGRK